MDFEILWELITGQRPMDWHQLWVITVMPDNIPIVILLMAVPVYTFIAFRQAFANDRLIAQLEADANLAKTHHRKTFPFQKGWADKVHVWPHLLKIEFLAAIIITTGLLIWSLMLDAPLEEPANPNLTMNPAKAPWYFLGLQEMLVYFDPWIAGVVLPGQILGGLMAIPYCDVSPLGNGYYTWKQRKFAIGFFLFGFIILWLGMSFIGTFIRGPGWMWFWPGQTWDHHRVFDETYKHLHELSFFRAYLHTPMQIAAFGAVMLGLYAAAVGGIIHKVFVTLKPQCFRKMNFLQYNMMIGNLVIMSALPVKMVLWHVFLIKYVWVTPWFNV